MALKFTLRQLEYFVAVGEAGSIAAAADRVNVSSPSISAAIAELEATFGVQLFIRRHARGLSLTPGGQRIFDEARQVLDRAAALHDHASEVAGAARGPLALGVLITVAPVLSASVRRSFEAAYPEAEVSLREAHQAELLRMLDHAEIDAAITYDMGIPKGVAFTPVVDLPPQVMLPRDHPLASRESVKLQELEAEPMVLLDLPVSRDYFLSMFHAEGLRPQIAERTAEIWVARSLVANGFGFSLSNLPVATEVAPDGEALTVLPLAGDHRPLSLGVATRITEHRSRIVEAFAAHMQDRARRRDLPGLGP